MSSDPAWTEIRVEVPVGWEELVSENLGEPPGTGAVIGPVESDERPAGDGRTWVRTYVPPGDDIASARVELAARLERLAEAVGDADLERLALNVRDVPDEDWLGAWQQHCRPFRVRRIAILAPDSEPAPKPDDVEIRLEPGRAFGTGRHATTRTCLLVLQQRMRPGDRILDAGTGSGILSVAAAKLGAGSCLGFDHSPHAASVFQTLVDRNGVGDTCEYREGSFDILDAGERYDIVLGNLFSDVLQKYATDLVARVREGGLLVASGCPVAHRVETLDALENAGFVLETATVRGRWCTFVGGVTAS